MKNENFLKSFKIAIYGLVCATKEENNFRTQLLIAFGVILFMIILGLNSIESSIILLTIFMVLSLELINSQIEKFLDLIKPDYHSKVKTIKDFSAAAVLISSIGSVIIGILIFMPYIVNFIKK